MSFNKEKAFEVDEGFIVCDKAGIFSGDDSPIGSDAPLGSRYYRTDGQVYDKIGPDVNDWEVTTRLSRKIIKRLIKKSIQLFDGESLLIRQGTTPAGVVVTIDSGGELHSI